MSTNEWGRYPSVPLVVHDPYFSVWSPADKLTDAWSVHWTGSRTGLAGLCWVDGKSWTFCGRPVEAPAMEQVSVRVYPTRTVYRFKCDEIFLDVIFLTPALLNDLDRLSRPVTYVVFDLTSRDNQKHEVKVLFDANGALCTNLLGEKVVWSHHTKGNLDVMRMGAFQQSILGHAGDDLRIDWGYLHLAVPRDGFSKSVIASNFITRKQFAQSGEIPTEDDADQPRTARDAWVCLTGVLEATLNPNETVTRHLLIGYDDLRSIEFLEQKLSGWWARNGMSFSEMLGMAEAEFAELRKTCEAYDEDLMKKYTAVGGEQYAYFAALAYRQAIGAHKLVASRDGEVLFFSKENFSNGCIATVDVTYPSAPLFLLGAPELLKGMLRPILEYSRTPRWKFPFAPHDLGTYPLANGQVYGGGERTTDSQMPVEECGNLLLLAAGLLFLCDEDEFVKQDYDLYLRWAEYLLEKGYDPERQLCTDDFAGHLAHNTNLALKAILAIGAFGRIAERFGDSAQAERFGQVAVEYANRWVKDADDGDHFRLAFDQPGSWSMKYNLVWDRLLGLELFPGVAEKEVSFYRKTQGIYGIALDNRNTWTKLDWILWVATLTGNRADFDALFAPVFRWMNEGKDRVPLADWYDTVNGEHHRFQARSVLGGIFLPLLFAKQESPTTSIK